MSAASRMSAVRPWIGPVAAAVALAALGLPWWLAAPGAVAAGIAARGRRLRARPLSIDERYSAAALLELMAACLDSGLSVPATVSAVLASDDPVDRVSTALGRAASLLELGAEPDIAWGSLRDFPELEALARAAARSDRAGLRLADAVRATAAELRRGAASLVTSSAARSGVAITAPLALCFLPAFVCLGLAPTVVGLVRSLHLW